jgi:hypothetical protein
MACLSLFLLSSFVVAEWLSKNFCPLTISSIFYTRIVYN